MFIRRGIWQASRSKLRYFHTQQKRHVPPNGGFLRISEEVREALHAGRPVVALETTIYTHGFPYPDNVALASHLESVVRVNGGVPATIGILDGIARVGMDPEELIRLAASAGKEDTLKISRRDLSYVCGMRLAGKNFVGGTTIAGTMILANLAGIKVFATGGLGGVHRGAESSMDISADLTELGRTPVAVISSGCKSFLDIQRTLEYLETEGTSVATFSDGRKGKVDFPAFWTRDSGFKSPLVINSELEAAAMIYAQNSLPVRSGMHFANPIPESAAISKEDNESWIKEAVKQADEAGASGKENTPFILNKIKELSGNKSIQANRALIESNVRRGTLVARELSIMESSNPGSKEGERSNIQSTSAKLFANAPPQVKKNTTTTESTAEELVGHDSGAKNDVIVAGSLAVDYACDYYPATEIAPITPQMHTSNPSRIIQTLGGVGYNIATGAHLLGANVKLYSAVADDLSGQAALSQLKREGKDTSGIQILKSANKLRTAQYIAVNDAHKELVLAMADMSIIETISPEMVRNTWLANNKLSNIKWLVADANWNSETLQAWLVAGKSMQSYTAFEPVSTAKATRLFDFQGSSRRSFPIFPKNIVDIATPNSHELSAMHQMARNVDLFEREDWWQVIDSLGIPSSGIRTQLAMNTSPDLVDQGIPQQSIQLLPFIPTILTTLGKQGVLLTMLLRPEDSRLRSSDSSPYILSRCTNGSLEVGGLYMRLFKPPRILGPEEVVSVNGAGDTFLGVLLAQMAGGKEVEQAIATAQEAALLSIQCKDAVSPDISRLR